ncbi:uncharacterized protein K460DRAFT_377418 [Cucurbitaria berberidis CBS 394.84]|uniref:F-box domain-containing protein n=1 Tax=Cucurbitaria berberidis CBS 394.84 TaxID=1168544 RepID=A0A9P4GJ89_9PLEO|nr:uncharacterized protein K460DRAFT_377418 [Cucurbitaria berberidis CBS 394.84]KAF1846130.1 hypothetical protein K460DRAFT_377418 [Cucurbitaria berberidis CBS 394.84]
MAPQTYDPHTRPHILTNILSENNKKADLDQKKPTGGAARCCFLELPPELRNRIYHFAQEIHFHPHGEVPPLLVKTTKATVLQQPYSARKFFALTQACKQIRSEFRPLWLRKSALRIEMKNVRPFITTYYPKTEEYKNAPSLLMVSWDHGDGEDDDVLSDVTLLCHLRAHSPTFTAEFVSRRLVDFDLPNVDCWDCGHSIHCDCGIDCEHEDARDEAICDLIGDHFYLRIVNKVLANSSEAWLKGVREDTQKDMKVEFTFDTVDQRATIYIRFLKGGAPALFDKKDMYNTAIRYLEQMGMLDLEHRQDLDFVVGEATDKYTRHFYGCHYATPTYSQIHISGRDLQSPDSTTAMGSQAVSTT